MTEPREALAALLHKRCIDDWNERFANGAAAITMHGEDAHHDLAAYLLDAGVHLGDEGLRKAAQAVVDHADPDDDPEGQYIDYIVPFEAIDALRAALAAQENPT